MPFNILTFSVFLKGPFSFQRSFFTARVQRYARAFNRINKIKSLISKCMLSSLSTESQDRKVGVCTVHKASCYPMGLTFGFVNRQTWRVSFPTASNRRGKKT
ncbi:hypothetical protein KP509_09G099200 [Ceratopteris richardii]|uniref:Uncharacterized protein n=1 Tax=Ceratopteris richardii TaxID=49495 RepID=A0A8T2U6W8_CERRI|nr:hypothetical protein KP509_09G099200 [Ceratopteris richardii]